MGTRCDLYLGTGPDAEWLGSLAFDGYAIHACEAGSDQDTYAVAYAKTPDQFRVAVTQLLASRRDSTRPEQGWPWPWEDSCTTDYAYCFVGEGVQCYCFGRGPVQIGAPFDDDDGNELVHEVPGVFPDMTARQRVTFGPRSGLIIIQAP